MKKKFFLLILLSALILGCGTKRHKKQMKDQEEFKVVELVNVNGVKIKIANFVGTVMSILVPDKNGKIGEIVLGYDTPEEYSDGNLYFGALIGRYGNRIAKGRFTLEGKNYKLARNNGQNHLHGGEVGYNNVFWDILETKPNAVQLY
ncbi:MAG: galactose-1-epimerase, partial [Bacteroidales bacterium]|nr:galactose-1-epimerase [Bacteroidales bacterium]